MYQLLRRQPPREIALEREQADHAKSQQSPARPTRPRRELGFALPEPARLSRGRALTFGVAGRAVRWAASSCWSSLPRNAARAELERETASASNAPPRLAVAPAKLVSSERALKLPASIQPLEEAVVYARANGYVARWLVDLGDKVKADQLLLEIETPEINQELSQARAALAKAQAAKAQAEAGRVLSKSRFDRTGKLVDAGVASQARARANPGRILGRRRQHQRRPSRHRGRAGQHSAPDRRAALLQGHGAVRRHHHRAQRRARQLGDGRQRDAARSSWPRPTPCASTCRCRKTSPPASASARTAKVTVRELTGQTFEGKVARTAGVLDAVTRTLNTEIRVPNPDGKLMSGMYAEVAAEPCRRRARSTRSPPPRC